MARVKDGSLEPYMTREESKMEDNSQEKIKEELWNGIPHPNTYQMFKNKKYALVWMWQSFTLASVTSSIKTVPEAQRT